VDKLYTFRGPFFTEGDLQAYRRRKYWEALYAPSTASERLPVKRNTDIEVAPRRIDFVASEAHSAPVEDEAVLLGGISITLDVALWRSRFFLEAASESCRASDRPQIKGWLAWRLRGWCMNTWPPGHKTEPTPPILIISQFS
jgi:hypothetical protein